MVSYLMRFDTRDSSAQAIGMLAEFPVSRFRLIQLTLQFVQHCRELGYPFFDTKRFDILQLDKTFQ
jgi:hypothetical protein